MMWLAMWQFTSCAQTSQKKQIMNTKKFLVAFFSRAGENYEVGYIEKGNTHILAEMIAAKTGGILFHIEPVRPYPEDYTECIKVAKTELHNQARPAVKGDVAVEDYDIIFIGYPNWWGDMPMAVYTFIEQHGWKDKTVIPFCTHEGSGLSGTARKLQQACQGATLLEGLAVRGSVAQNSPEQVRKSVEHWLQKLKY